jgi:SAM-dependent methyltransferase
MKQPNFSTVTEISGDNVSAEQIGRAVQRYAWAASLSKGRDVLEIACGTGQGLGLLAASARSVAAGDIDPNLVARAKAHYGERFRIAIMDAAEIPFSVASLDVIILFEAIYYLPDVPRFLAECHRVLRPGGQLLLCTANKDLVDFNPSPFAVRYYGVRELADVLRHAGFDAAFLAGWPMAEASLRQRALRPAKRLAVNLGLMPRTMDGKKLLKRLVFGKLQAMPAELTVAHAPYQPPSPIPQHCADTRHSVIYCVAERPT